MRDKKRKDKINKALFAPVANCALFILWVLSFLSSVCLYVVESSER